jgi:peptidyl-dipeptidase A
MRVLVLAVLVAAAAVSPAPAKEADVKPTAPSLERARDRGRPPTVEDARAFVEDAEKRLLRLWIDRERAAWVQSTYITVDTERMAAEAAERVIATTVDLAREATRFDAMKLPEDVARKLRLLKTSLATVGPPDPAKQAEVAQIGASMESTYGKGQYCGPDGRCRDLTALSRVLDESRDPAEMLDAWVGWRTISPPMREPYRQFVELNNEGARALGFADAGAMWRSGYDMPPDTFAAEVERLWTQVRPLYEALHCHVRARLSEAYGKDVVAPTGPMPAHVLGNMWSQAWGAVYDLVKPPEPAAKVDVTESLRAKKVDPVQMVKMGERFFTSLGFAPLPQTFWERSMFVKPADRDVVCHASAWDIDFVDDLRLKMCIEPNNEDFRTIHHELGHNFYQRAYAGQPALYRNSANDAFHEGIGDTVALSVTPEYLVEIGLVEGPQPGPEGDLPYLMRMALDKVAFLPFGKLIDQWRWDVFAGRTPPERYNAAWWDLVLRYQGIVPPVPRTEQDFDPGAKYHVPANVPYTRYFLAHVLQFQMHRGLCRIAGETGPLHRCSIYGNEKAGAALRKMLEMGQSRPWPEALEVATGERAMDAGALLEYFEPLSAWLAEQNRGRTCGW